MAPLPGSPIKPDATEEQVKKFLETEKGESPFADEESEDAGPNGAETTVMDGGVAQIAELDLRKGKYAFFCFVADRQGGPPHVMKGMVSVVEVE